ncbi:MAG TPA: hypothetical protein PLD25_18265 [Chloroflexota bacterium]|nr:hypothetical protein [Chloroflexota bacterium]
MDICEHDSTLANSNSNSKYKNPAIKIVATEGKAHLRGLYDSRRRPTLPFVGADLSAAASQISNCWEKGIIGWQQIQVGYNPAA